MVMDIQQKAGDTSTAAVVELQHKHELGTDIRKLEVANMMVFMTCFMAIS